MKGNWLFRLIAVLAIAILGLWLLQTLLFGIGTGMSFGYRGNIGGGHMYGLGYGFSATSLLLLLIKFLFVVFVIAFIAGLFVWIKNNIFTSDDVEAMRNTLRGKSRANTAACSICGKEVSTDWKVCPYCGKELEVKTA